MNNTISTTDLPDETADETADETTEDNYQMYCEDGCTEDTRAIDMKDAMQQALAWVKCGDWQRGDQTYRVQYGVRSLDSNAETWDWYTVEPLPAPECEYRHAEGNLYPGLRVDEESGHVWEASESSPRSSYHGQLEHTDYCVRCGMFRIQDNGATDPEDGTATTRITYTEATEESAAEAAKWRGDAQEDEDDEASTSL